MKKVLGIVLILCLVVSLAAVLVACDKGEKGTFSGDYDVTKVTENVNALRTGSGISVKYVVSGTVSTTVVFSAKGDVYYFNVSEGTTTSEVYYDMSDANTAYLYTKENNAWQKTAIAKSTLKTQLDQAFQGIVAYLSAYSAYGDVEGEKTSDTIAGRDCDVYKFDYTDGGVTAACEVAIDKATGICMKATATYDGKTDSIICTNFNTSPTINLPQVNTNNNSQSGNDGNQSGNGNGETGADDSGNDNGNSQNSNENGQSEGGDGETGDDSGNDGGQNEGGNGDEETVSPTSILYSYPHIADGASFEAAFNNADGFSATCSMFGHYGTTEYNTTKVIKVKGDIIYTRTIEDDFDLIQIFDARAEDSYVIYSNNGSNSFAEKYYYGEDGTQCESKQDLKASIMSDERNMFVLPIQTASMSGMNKSTATYIDRVVDSFTMDYEGASILIYVDQVTGIVLKTAGGDSSASSTLQVTEFALEATIDLPTTKVYDPHNPPLRMIASMDNYDDDINVYDFAAAFVSEMLSEAEKNGQNGFTVTISGYNGNEDRSFEEKLIVSKEVSKTDSTKSVVTFYRYSTDVFFGCSETVTIIDFGNEEYSTFYSYDNSGAPLEQFEWRMEQHNYDKSLGITPMDVYKSAASQLFSRLYVEPGAGGSRFEYDYSDETKEFDRDVYCFTSDRQNGDYTIVKETIVDSRTIAMFKNETIEFTNGDQSYYDGFEVEGIVFEVGTYTHPMVEE